MRNLAVVVLGMLTLQPGLPDEAAGQELDPETIAIMATATKAVLIPTIPGRLLVSTTINYGVDLRAATAISSELGGIAIAREAAFACDRDPDTGKPNKRTCLVDGGQLIEVRAVERNGSSAQVIVRLYTNEGLRSPTARQFRVDLETSGAAWRVSNKVLLEIT